MRCYLVWGFYYFNHLWPYFLLYDCSLFKHTRWLYVGHLIKSIYVKTLLKHKCFHLFAIICLNFGYMGNGRKKHSMSQWDNSVGKGACQQVWQSEFNPQKSYGRRKERTPQAILWPPGAPLFIHIIHTYTQTNKCKNIEILVFKNPKHFRI